MSLCSANRFIEYILSRPPSLESSPDYARSNSANFSPLHHAMRFSVKGQKTIISLVSLLLNVCSPPYVTGFIIAALLGISINAHSAWALAHVSEKRLERISPFIAHNNSATTVITKPHVIRIVATLNHARPYFVCPSWFLTTSVTVRRVGDTCYLATVTPARCRIPTTKGLSGDLTLGMEVATAPTPPPCPSLMFVLRKSQNRPSTKSSSRQINSLRHYNRSCSKPPKRKSEGRFVAVNERRELPVPHASAISHKRMYSVNLIIQ